MYCGGLEPCERDDFLLGLSGGRGAADLVAFFALRSHTIFSLSGDALAHEPAIQLDRNVHAY